MTEMLEFVLPIFSASNIFFFWFINGEIPIINLISLGIGVLHAIIPMQLLNEKWFPLPESTPND